MKDLMIFKNEELGEIRTVTKENKPYLCLADVCKILDLEQVSRVKSRLSQDGVIISKVIDTLGREQQATFINESNLYKVIFQSRKPEAEKFTEWVTSEVLPSIRQNGGYIAGQEQLSDSELMAKAVLVAQNTIEEKNRLLQQAYKQIEADSKKVLFANAVTTSKNSILVGELAKILNQMGYDIGEKRLFEWLRNNGYLIRRKGNDYNVPTQKSMDLGLFEIKETTIASNSGTIIKKTSRVTGKGQVYLVNKYAEYANRNT